MKALVDILLKQMNTLVACLLERTKQDRIALLQGTLDLLILRTLLFGPQHGHGITLSIQRQSEETLIVDHGSLYPALQRLEEQGSITAAWGTSDNNRKRPLLHTHESRKKAVDG